MNSTETRTTLAVTIEDNGLGIAVFSADAELIGYWTREDDEPAEGYYACSRVADENWLPSGRTTDPIEWLTQVIARRGTSAS